MKQTLVIVSPCRIKSSGDALVVISRESKESLPLASLRDIVIATRHCLITGSAISLCISRKVTLTVCNDRHLPGALIIDPETLANRSAILRQQQDFDPQLAAELWRLIVRCKLRNQVEVLRNLGKTADGSAINSRAENVTRESATADEAASARRYWRVVSSQPIRRRTNDPRNNFLNYGYALIRSLLAQFLAVRGFDLRTGIHHCSRGNSLNLVYDLIEPFRPLVDEHVLQILAAEGANVHTSLTRADKVAIIRLLDKRVEVMGKVVTLRHACEQVASSFEEVLCKKNPSAIALPTIGRSRAAP